jgi:hypothetical protein
MSTSRDAPRQPDRFSDPFAPREGDRILVPCVGGPSSSRLELYPPPLEVVKRQGTYVLVDDGPRKEWHYSFVPHIPLGSA